METYVFDAYGTLFDVHAALAKHRSAAGTEADRFSEIWRAKQLEYTWTLTLAGQYRDFWTLTQEALDYAFARFPSVDRALRDKLLDAYIALDAFADARDALRRLRGQGHRTAILSNGSPRMLDGAVTASALGPSLDAVLSADPVRLYKPRPEVYALATDRFDVAPDAITFVSSNAWDIMGASCFGFRAIWLNRSDMPAEYPTAGATLATLASLDEL